jgi:hypothetical protein
MNFGNKSKAFVVGISVVALGLLASPSASANYPPGLPEPTVNVPNNPPVAATVSNQVTIVNQKVAESTPVEAVKKEPTERMGVAPKPGVPVGDPIALRTRGLDAGGTYIVKIRTKFGKYSTLGSVIGNDAGTGRLPVFEVSQNGVYIIAMTNVQTGETIYIKVEAR